MGKSEKKDAKRLRHIKQQNNAENIKKNLKSRKFFCLCGGNTQYSLDISSPQIDHRFNRMPTELPEASPAFSGRI